MQVRLSDCNDFPNFQRKALNFARSKKLILKAELAALRKKLETGIQSKKTDQETDDELETRTAIQSEILARQIELEELSKVLNLSADEKESKEIASEEEFKRYQFYMTSQFFQKLIANPVRLLTRLMNRAEECMAIYEHAHPIDRSATAREYLARFAQDTTHIRNLSKNLSSQALTDALTPIQARVYCNYLFTYYYNLFKSCKNNEPDLAKLIQSFFSRYGLKADEPFFDTSGPWGELIKIPPLAKLEDIEQQKYDKALKRFNDALQASYPDLEKSNDYNKFKKLTTLKDNFQPRNINFYSLLLNTAAQRLEDPNYELHKERLDNLANYASQFDPLSKLFIFIGLVVALVGLALLLSPTLPGILVAGAANAATTTAAAITGAGTLTTGLSKFSLWCSSSTKIRAANNAITKQTGAEETPGTPVSRKLSH